MKLPLVEQVLYRYIKKIYLKNGKTIIHNEIQEYQYMTLEPSQGRRVNSVFSPNIFLFFIKLNHLFVFLFQNQDLSLNCDNVKKEGDR